MDEVQPDVSDAPVGTATEAANRLIQRYIDELDEAGGGDAVYASDECKVLEEQLNKHYVAAQPNIATFFPLYLKFLALGCERTIPRFPENVDPLSTGFFLYPAGTFQGFFPGTRKWRSSSFYLGEGASWDQPGPRVPHAATICARDQNNNESSRYFKAVGTPVKFEARDIAVRRLSPVALEVPTFTLRAASGEVAGRYLRPYGRIFTERGLAPQDAPERDLSYASERGEYLWTHSADGPTHRLTALQHWRPTDDQEFLLPVGRLTSVKAHWDQVTCVDDAGDHSTWEMHDFAGGGWK
ncbi:hypothetical protein ABZ926_09215 [Streptomyces litmocidini]|uniref:hypothetical protein n=1 Tax=Streptomyces litmocidini TaxID=67318 RepID=UPI0034045C65